MLVSLMRNIIVAACRGICCPRSLPAMSRFEFIVFEHSGISLVSLGPLG